jgi:mannose-6-phosphate isomerase-like protein (cupin superfamily)
VTQPAAAASSGDPARRVEKPWGHELIWAVHDRYVGKILHLTAGHRLSLQYHERKDESILVLKGTLRFHLAAADGTMTSEDLGPGDHRRVPVGRVHRYEAVAEDVDLVEVSTPELEDVVRIEDDFGGGTNAPDSPG